MAVDIQYRIFIFYNGIHFVNGLQRKIFAAGDMTLPIFLGRAHVQQDSSGDIVIILYTLIDVVLFKKIKETFEYEMSVLNTDYIDFGFLHCIDQLEDLEQLMNNGTVEFVKNLKEKGIIRYIGFSSHTPSVAEKVLDLGLIEPMKEIYS